MSVSSGWACSTHVEMFLPTRSRKPQRKGMLHARGDVSIDTGLASGDLWHAPRTWRCFYTLYVGLHDKDACSTHVEMFPQLQTSLQPQWCMLHARGDVSFGELDEYPEFRYAPRTWRCFRGDVEGRQRSHVCSTYVEMFQFLLSLFFEGTAVQRVYSPSSFFTTSRRIIKGNCRLIERSDMRAFLSSARYMMYSWIGPGFLGRELLIAE